MFCTYIVLNRHQNLTTSAFLRHAQSCIELRQNPVDKKADCLRRWTSLTMVAATRCQA